jgi:hypothetical protein
MKNGWRTSEFWITTLTIVGTLAGVAVGFLPAAAVAPVAAVGTAAYAISRGLAKLRHPPTGDTDGTEVNVNVSAPPPERPLIK